MRIVLMGMPGVGKGTQAVRLKEALETIHVSTGDILREAVHDGSPLGKQVREFLDSGRLVPDSTIGELIRERLRQPDAQRGFILDGFPRTPEQVSILDSLLADLGVELDGVFLLTAPDDEIIARLSGRRVCPKCDAVYHLSNQPPKSPGVCEACSSALVQRPDDMEQVIRDRLEVYQTQTQPVVDIYRERGLLDEIDGTGVPEAVFARLSVGLGKS